MPKIIICQNFSKSGQNRRKTTNNLYGSQILFDLPTDDYKFDDETFVKRERSKHKGANTE